MSEKFSAQIINGRFVVSDSAQFNNLNSGIECIAFDTHDITKLGAPRKVLIKKINGVIEIVVRPSGSNLTGYSQLSLVDLEPTHLQASVEETKRFIEEPSAIIERTLSSGARFTDSDLNGLPKEAHYLIYKEDSNGARVFNVINVNTNKEYQKFGIKSQIERGVARVLVAYCDNVKEMSALTKAQRQEQYYKYVIKLVEYNDYLAINPNYKK